MASHSEKKIALIGSAPSSVNLAPYDDHSWEIWGCSPGAWPNVKRVDRWFELHRFHPTESWYNKDYINWMAGLECPVYTSRIVPELPNCTLYPVEEVVDRFGPFFFTSSLSWMFAMAIREGATEIGLWGVDMSHQTEWEFQRSGCHFFIQLARIAGIRVSIPPESDLLQPPALYGFCEWDPMHIKLGSRTRELTAQMSEAEQHMSHNRDKYWFFKGALDQNNYMLKTWITGEDQKRLAYANPPVEPAEIQPEPNGMDHAEDALEAL